MLTLVCHFKKVMHRRLYNGFVQSLGTVGLSIDDDGFVPLSIAQFSL